MRAPACGALTAALLTVGCAPAPLLTADDLGGVRAARATGARPADREREADAEIERGQRAATREEALEHVAYAEATLALGAAEWAAAEELRRAAEADAALRRERFAQAPAGGAARDRAAREETRAADDALLAEGKVPAARVTKGRDAQGEPLVAALLGEATRLCGAAGAGDVPRRKDLPTEPDRARVAAEEARNRCVAAVVAHPPAAATPAASLVLAGLPSPFQERARRDVRGVVLRGPVSDFAGFAAPPGVAVVVAGHDAARVAARLGLAGARAVEDPSLGAAVELVLRAPDR